MSKNIDNIKKHARTEGPDSAIYTEIMIIFDLPSAGKSFIGELVVLFYLSQRLNVASTSIIGVRANCLGGTHIHKLFCMLLEQHLAQTPFRCAEIAMQKIKQ